MAVVSIPTPRALMVRGDGKIIRHGKKVAVFPDWRQMSERYSGHLYMEWGGLSWSRTYENNYLTWIEPWEKKPTVPIGGIAPVPVTMPPVYALWVPDTSYDFKALVDLCEQHYNVSFFRDNAHRAAWAYAQPVGGSDSEKVIPGMLCCASSWQDRDDPEYGHLADYGMIAVAFSCSGRNLFGFNYHGNAAIFSSAFSLIKPDGLATVRCEGIQPYSADGSKMNFYGERKSSSSPTVPVRCEVRTINAAVPFSYTSTGLTGWAYRSTWMVDSNEETNSRAITNEEISGVFSGVSGSPFAVATF